MIGFKRSPPSELEMQSPSIHRKTVFSIRLRADRLLQNENLTPRSCPGRAWLVGGRDGDSGIQETAARHSFEYDSTTETTAFPDPHSAGI